MGIKIQSELKTKRRITPDEERLLNALIKSASIVLPDNWMKELLVEDMNDGGMGSLLLFPFGTAPEKRMFGELVSELEFKDADDVLIIASLHTDREENLYELDMWKVNGAPLIKIPEVFGQVTYMMEKTVYTQDVFTINNFLSQQECIELIRKSEEMGYEEATVDVGSSQQRMIKGVRNNERVLYNDETYAALIWERLKEFAPQGKSGEQACGLNELFRFYKYTPGQRFKMHKDGSFKRNPYEASQYTFMIYLNDEYTGGETVFASGEIIRPQSGTALIFHHPLRHEGSILMAGVKYVLRSDIMYRI
jgi:prolyl 4-hydroxylase